jgi:hypothetical protein
MAYANTGNAFKSGTYADAYRKRAAPQGVKAPRINQPKAGTPAACVTFFHEKLLPDWERADLP